MPDRTPSLTSKTTATAPAPIEGDWIVRGIMPVISRIHLDRAGVNYAGVIEIWGDIVNVDGERRGSDLVLRTSADSAYALVLMCRVDSDELRITFTNVGVDFDLLADRADAERLREFEADRPSIIPAPELHDVAPNGLAERPPMGWNSWYALRLQLDDTSVREIADAMVTSGLREAGYTYVNLDDGWQGGRDHDGSILPNHRFPDMAGLGDYLHSRGLRFGIYSSPGPATCADYTGSYGREEQDARTFAAWGVDYLKYDWCSAGAFYRTEGEMRGVFQRMGDALRASGRPIVFSLCQYGAFDVARWGRSVGGNLWRTTFDIEPTWDSIAAIGFADQVEPEGGWNDPDMLQVGLGDLSLTEQRTQITLWSMLSAPLIISCDVRDLSPDEIALLTNKHVIAIDQDRLASPPERHRFGDVDVWTKQLEFGTAVAVVNRHAEAVFASVPWAEVSLDNAVQARDIWNETEIAPCDAWSGTIPAHGCVLLLVWAQR